MKTFSEEPRTATEDERQLARSCAGLARRAAEYLEEVAVTGGNVSDLLVERMWDFTAFPIVHRQMIEELRAAKKESVVPA